MVGLWHCFTHISPIKPRQIHPFILPCQLQATHRADALLEGAGAVGPRPLLGAIDIAVLVVEGLPAAVKVHLHRGDEAPIGRLLGQENWEILGALKGFSSNQIQTKKQAGDLPIYLCILGNAEQKTSKNTGCICNLYSIVSTVGKTMA